MVDLLRRARGNHGKLQEITPESAHWKYVGFSLYKLDAGEACSEPTGDREVILVLVEGKAEFQQYPLFEDTGFHIRMTDSPEINGISLTQCLQTVVR